MILKAVSTKIIPYVGIAAILVMCSRLFILFSPSFQGGSDWPSDHREDVYK